MQPSYHDAGFLGAEVPVYNIADFCNATDTQDLLVRNVRLGAALASCFSASNTTYANGTDITGAPAHVVVQQQNRGLVIVGPDIVSAVTRAVYTQENVRNQTNGVLLAGLAGAAGQPASAGGAVQYLTPCERQDSNFNGSSVGYLRPWTLWLRRTEADGFYHNSLGSPLSS
ncbi:hypothetical protein W97_08340 [Coniosporium apollinis CBS 100218]|uniref:Uncharacterized protein n=1 Tax=Coniosporium apollinis (strain CBS 100218) TaxID=1168221 RepID=R7Z579_CONA1|nr:uncharacterized protein W97_08340 [Coniosporium apollinis CBS 100218]EON69154.1 hypothetical protein W97_08340 [Coniosporium apollinis CBS 100218]